jgi:hypothetical protein
MRLPNRSPCWLCNRDEAQNGPNGASMHQDLIDRAFSLANQMAEDQDIQIDQNALMDAVIAVMGNRDGQDEPREIAEDALELLGKTPGPSSSRRGRRPF